MNSSLLPLVVSLPIERQHMLPGYSLLKQMGSPVLAALNMVAGLGSFLKYLGIGSYQYHPTGALPIKVASILQTCIANFARYAVRADILDGNAIELFENARDFGFLKCFTRFIGQTGFFFPVSACLENIASMKLGTLADKIRIILVYDSEASPYDISLGSFFKPISLSAFSYFSHKLLLYSSELDGGHPYAKEVVQASFCSETASDFMRCCKPLSDKIDEICDSVSYDTIAKCGLEIALKIFLWELPNCM